LADLASPLPILVRPVMLSHSTLPPTLNRNTTHDGGEIVIEALRIEGKHLAEIEKANGINGRFMGRRSPRKPA
jgi:hypothetical protein